VLALRHNLRQVQREGIAIREAREAELRSLEESWSWRLTRPLRGLADVLRREA
jgi:hypothetical protein